VTKCARLAPVNKRSIHRNPNRLLSAARFRATAGLEEREQLQCSLDSLPCALGNGNGPISRDGDRFPNPFGHDAGNGSGNGFHRFQPLSKMFGNGPAHLAAVSNSCRWFRTARGLIAQRGSNRAFIIAPPKVRIIDLFAPSPCRTSLRTFLQNLRSDAIPRKPSKDHPWRTRCKRGYTAPRSRLR